MKGGRREEVRERRREGGTWEEVRERRREVGDILAWYYRDN